MIITTDVRLSPDGSRAALVVPDSLSGNRDIWLLHLATGNMTRLTSHPANDWWPTWHPDNRRLAFASDRDGRSTVYLTTFDGAHEQRLVQIPNRGAFPKDWSSDGALLSLNIDTPDGVPSIWAVAASGEGKPFPLNHSAARENNPVWSPDGGWIAYESAESGTTEIYVKRVARGERIRISTAGGSQPRWPRGSREILYRAPNGDVMAVNLDGGAPDAPGRAVRLFAGCAETGFSPFGGPIPYDVTADGRRFLLPCSREAARPEIVTVVIDWASTISK
ncbi:MAG TPA: hypothetical protein VLD67_01165 [Vicinamibacterales bacterium]|nr:hypothetical protein [Vicinamibacterales bacterium]